MRERTEDAWCEMLPGKARAGVQGCRAEPSRGYPGVERP